ncbi:MAG: CTP synthase [Spirochaetaceae bacterium]
MKKYIFVTGGVCSSLGKGVAASSLGSILESRNLKVRMIKVDPYINVDAGTMSPYQHGEVYVTDDGAETDLDLGNYARFTHSPLGKENSITTGQIYEAVIKKEREGRYLGKCVQVVPHITDEIKRRIRAIGNSADVDVTIVEIGGTVGDIESIPYLEAVRQLIHDLGHNNALSVHLTLIPTVSGGEAKTKPTQHSVKSMREIGIQPDVLLCRADKPVPDDMKKKISQFTNMDFEAVISAHNVDSTLYAIPEIYSEQGLDEVVCRKLQLEPKKPNLKEWKKVRSSYEGAKVTANIAFVGKYIELADAYKSVDEALIHGGIANKAKVNIIKIDAEYIETLKDPGEALKGIDGVIIPGGFGERGVLGMIQTAKYARENKIPCLGICLGMQVMVIEWARNILKMEKADSSEFRPEGTNNVVALLEDQVDITDYGGTMRLGLSESVLKPNTKIAEAYGSLNIFERHRHRLEVSNEFKDVIEKSGLIISGTTSDGKLVEAVEWPNHPWAVGVQAHPEFTSQPINAGPLFKKFIEESLRNGKKIK